MPVPAASPCWLNGPWRWVTLASIDTTEPVSLSSTPATLSDWPANAALDAEADGCVTIFVVVPPPAR